MIKRTLVINLVIFILTGYLYAETVTKDPFIPQLPAKKPPKQIEPPPKEIPKPMLSIQGLVWQTSMPQAIVNNKVVKMGDSLTDEIKILDVSRDGISIEYQGATFFYSADVLIPKKEERIESKPQKKGL